MSTSITEGQYAPMVCPKKSWGGGLRTRIVYSTTAFAELVLWQLPKPLPGCAHRFKYRLAYVVRETCVLRYDNEAGKGDHRHYGGKERAYAFSDPDTLIDDFQGDIARWNHENRHP